jgi:cellulose synthase/poly-beta-1,6-N-acetylglucosamine synthase-like glycosyltransferase
VCLALLLVATACGLLIAPIVTLTVVNGILIVFFAAAYAMKLALIRWSLKHPAAIAIDPFVAAAIPETELPVYTILLPVYREAAVLGQLVQGICALDYPQQLLDVKLVLEQDDIETRRAAAQLSLPACFEVLVVPDVGPRGKARACNQGLSRARGDFVVIFDAEDCPEPDQLRKAVVAFSGQPPEVVCLQAKLNYFNRDHNLLTRWFTAEYSVWFDQFLPGLSFLDVAIPLGGTSNHFVTDRLRELGGWNAYNVTEDADLGVRIFLRGWKTSILDATTYEEATSRYGNWLRQRSRWVKGYMQTYLLYMQHPVRVWHQMRPKAFAAFHLFFGANTVCLMVNPFYFALIIIWYTARPGWMERIFPPPIFYLAIVGLFVANAAWVLSLVSGCYARRNYADVKWAFLAPIYWLFMSLASYKALVQLVRDPWYWEKTDHGFCSLADHAASVEETPYVPRFAANGNGSTSGRGERWPVRPERWTYAIDVWGTGTDLKYPEGYHTGGVYRTKAGAHGALTSVRRAVERRGGSLGDGPGVVPIAPAEPGGDSGAVTAVALRKAPPARAAHATPAARQSTPQRAPAGAVRDARSSVLARAATHELAPVLVVALIAAIAASLWSGLTHSMVLYGDATAHLNVARRVTDGLSVGLAQLGSVWLPLPQLLLVPFAAVRSLWHSGVAGALVSGGCFVYSAARIYSLVKELSGSRLGAWCAFAAFTLNLNMLYVQTTALTEPVLLAFCIGAVFHLARWMRTFSMVELTWAAVLTALAVLSRYEGWAVLFTEVAVVALWGYLTDRRKASPQANSLLFSVIGAYSIVLWLLYNLIIFHDPLYFLHSIYSAQVINGAQAQFGLLGTKGSVGTSLLTYGWDLVGVVGPVVGIASALAIVLVAVRHPQRQRTLLVLTILAAPVLFLIVSLYAGQITIRVPQLAPHQMWNDRYGLMALPLCAVALGCVAAYSRVHATAAVGIILAGVAVMSLGTPLTLADGETGISSATARHRPLIADYLQTHYRGGEVLADDLSAAPLMFESDLDLDQFVSPGFHPYWERALAAPARRAEWVVAYSGDSVSADIAAHPDRFLEFRDVLTDGRARLYKREAALALAMQSNSALELVGLYEGGRARLAVYEQRALKELNTPVAYSLIQPMATSCRFAALRAGVYGAAYSCVSTVSDNISHELRTLSDKHVECAASDAGPVDCVDGLGGQSLPQRQLQLAGGRAL